MKYLATTFFVFLLFTCKKNEQLPASVYTPNKSDANSYFKVNGEKYLVYGRQINWLYPNYKTFYVIKFDDEENHKGDYYAMYFTFKSMPVNKKVYYVNIDNDTLTNDSTYLFIMERYYKESMTKFLPAVPRIKGMPLSYNIDSQGKMYFSFDNTQFIQIIPESLPREKLDTSAQFEYLEK